VFVKGLSVAVNPDGSVLGGVCTPDRVVRVQLVSEPGRQHTPWLPVPDWLDRYQAPATTQDGSHRVR
jgi:hypothetical protein